MRNALKILALIVLVPILALAAMVWGVIRFFLRVAVGILTAGAVISLLTWMMTGGLRRTASIRCVLRAALDRRRDLCRRRLWLVDDQ